MQKVNSSMISKYTGAVQPKKVRLSPMARIWLLLGVSLLAIALFMTINLNGNISYILTHRLYYSDDDHRRLCGRRFYYTVSDYRQ